MSMSVIPEAPDCSSIFQLPPINPGLEPIDKLSSDTLILVSQPRCGTTDTGYMSKCATLGEVDYHISTLLGIEEIREDLSGKVNRSEMSVYGTLCANTEIPYILSSFTLSASMVVSVDGYPLSDGMSMAIDRNGYIPNRLSVSIGYSPDYTSIIVRNFDGTISSSIPCSPIVSNLLSRVSALERRLSAISLVTYENPIYRL